MHLFQGGKPCRPLTQKENRLNLRPIMSWRSLCWQSWCWPSMSCTAWHFRIHWEKKFKAISRNSTNRPHEGNKVSARTL